MSLFVRATWLVKNYGLRMGPGGELAIGPLANFPVITRPPAPPLLMKIFSHLSPTLSACIVLHTHAPKLVKSVCRGQSGSFLLSSFRQPDSLVKSVEGNLAAFSCHHSASLTAWLKCQIPDAWKLLRVLYPNSWPGILTAGPWKLLTAGLAKILPTRLQSRRLS